MKNLLIICCFCLSANVMMAQDFIYYKLDQKLISLWVAADEDNNDKEFGLLYDDVTKEFDKVFTSLRQERTPHFNKEQFEKYCTKVIHVLKRYVEKPNPEKIKFFSLELLFENYSLRGCLSDSKYPLDDFLVLHESYQSVQSVVEDPMMELLEWFEFMQLVTLLVDNWEIYDCLPFKEIQKFFPNISEEDHQYQKNKANDCLNAFTESLNSANRNEFELPCDELGIALSNIFKLYTYD